MPEGHGLGELLCQAVTAGRPLDFIWEPSGILTPPPGLTGIRKLECKESSGLFVCPHNCSPFRGPGFLPMPFPSSAFSSFVTSPQLETMGLPAHLGASLELARLDREQAPGWLPGLRAAEQADLRKGIWCPKTHLMLPSCT